MDFRIIKSNKKKAIQIKTRTVGNDLKKVSDFSKGLGSHKVIHKDKRDRIGTPSDKATTTFKWLLQRKYCQEANMIHQQRIQNTNNVNCRKTQKKKLGTEHR